MADNPRVILSGFADEAANQKTAVQQFAAFAALGLQYYSIRFIDVGTGIKNVMKLSLAEIQKVRQLAGRVRAERLVDRLADRQGEAPGRRRRHEERLRAVQEVSGQGREEGLRAGPRLRDQADPRLLLLSSQGDRSPRAPGPGRRPTRPDRRGVPPLRPDLRPGGRGEPGRRHRPAAGRDPPPGEPPGHGAGLRRRQPHRAGLLAGRGLRAVHGHEAGPRLDAHQGLPQPRADRQGRARRTRTS